MQAAAVCFTGPLPIKSTKSLTPKGVVTTPRRRTFVCPMVVATAAAESSSTVDYNSLTSVFPAEACDIIGGEACIGLRCPEAKLSASPSKGNASVATEEVDREYIEYNNQPKTVFPGEACDELGGEFCEADYQMGVYKEMVLAE